MFHSVSRKKYLFRVRGGQLELGSRTFIMGILNVTPDSFSDGGRFFDPNRAIERAWQIAQERADILDIGAESTRPGADPVGAEDELSRLLPVLEGIGEDYPIPISVDTYKEAVARAALERGAAIVNDVSGLRDPLMAKTAASFGAGMILMHMRGEPKNMQDRTPSRDILQEIAEWAHEAVASAQSFGVSSDEIVLDPGIGFGKTANQNLEILRNLEEFSCLGFPLMVGTSRKSFIGEVTGDSGSERIPGTSAAVAASIFSGAHIVRVHDVAAMKDVALVADSIIGERSGK
jgi:dihydropteroate synthase